MIKCCVCKELKNKNEFKKYNLNGNYYICISCQKERMAKYYQENKDKVKGNNKIYYSKNKDIIKDRNVRYSRTKNGFIHILYSRQKARNKFENIKLNYSFEEFKNWIKNNILFDKLYDDWKNSGFVSNLSPSIDRIDNKVGYNLNNIQFLTWKENKEKGAVERKRKIVQIDLEGDVINVFSSIKEASEFTEIKISNIERCLNSPRRKTAGGYIWKGINK